MPHSARGGWAAAALLLLDETHQSSSGTAKKLRLKIQERLGDVQILLSSQNRACFKLFQKEDVMRWYATRESIINQLAVRPSMDLLDRANELYLEIERACHVIQDQRKDRLREEIFNTIKRVNSELTGPFRFVCLERGEAYPRDKLDEWNTTMQHIASVMEEEDGTEEMLKTTLDAVQELDADIRTACQSINQTYEQRRLLAEVEAALSSVESIITNVCMQSVRDEVFKVWEGKLARFRFRMQQAQDTSMEGLGKLLDDVETLEDEMDSACMHYYRARRKAKKMRKRKKKKRKSDRSASLSPSPDDKATSTNILLQAARGKLRREREVEAPGRTAKLQEAAFQALRKQDDSAHPNN